MTKTLRPYISLDLETTGLSVDKVDAIEIGMVLDDGVSPVGDLDKISLIIDIKSFDYSEPFAMQLNQRILKAISDKEGAPIEDVIFEMESMVKKCQYLASDYDKEYTPNGREPKKTKIQIAGKNPAGFDLPILRNSFRRQLEKSDTRKVGTEHIDKFKKILKTFQHRVIDPGPMYFTDFGYVPALQQINQLLGREDVSHTAVEDAMDVVVAIRYKMGFYGQKQDDNSTK